jgi:hypothetical protein
MGDFRLDILQETVEQVLLHARNKTGLEEDLYVLRRPCQRGVS